MVRLLSSLALLAVMAGAGAVASPPIASDTLLDHIKFLASDELRGRANGTKDLDRAADYIAAQFESAGLQPAGKGGWFQPFDLVAGLAVGRGNHITIRAGEESIHLTLGDAYYPLAATPAPATAPQSLDLDDVPLVFSGYGISSPAMQYDDYAGIDVKGKAVVIFSHEPQEKQRDSRLNGDRPLRETTLYNKALAARSRGARALLVVSDPSHETDQANYGHFLDDPDAEDHGIPVLRLARSELTPLLDTWQLDRVAAEIDQDLVPRSRPLPGATLDYTQRLTTNRQTVRNVVGILPGHDERLGAEAVVIGAHYDHVGVGGRFSTAPDRTGEIHNGADDNASGTAAIIEIARAAAADRSRFPRSLVFVAFAGEERGLLGSSYYTANPPIPLANTVAMLNLDMVGRANGKVDVAGLDRAPSLMDAVHAAARAAGGIEIRQEGPGAGRSDDSSFLDRRIPAINFFTGFHRDYHAPDDDWQRIDSRGVARVATVALELAAHIAARHDRPALQE